MNTQPRNSVDETVPTQTEKDASRMLKALALLITWFLLRLTTNEVLATLLDRHDQETGLNAAVLVLLMAQLLIELFFLATWVGLVTRSFAIWICPDRVPLTTESGLGICNRVAIELVRAVSAILYRVPILVLPAIVEMARLSFVPFLATFDPAYHRGQTDALAASRRLFSQNALFVILAVLLFVPGWMVAESLLLPASLPFFEAPIQALLLSAFSLLGTACLSAVMVFLLFRNQEPFLLHHGADS